MKDEKNIFEKFLVLKIILGFKKFEMFLVRQWW